MFFCRNKRQPTCKTDSEAKFAAVPEVQRLRFGGFSVRVQRLHQAAETGLSVLGRVEEEQLFPRPSSVCASHVDSSWSCSGVDADAGLGPADTSLHGGLICIGPGTQKKKKTDFCLISCSPGLLFCTNKKDLTLLLCYLTHKNHDGFTCHSASCVWRRWSRDGLGFGVCESTLKGLVCSEKCTFLPRHSALNLLCVTVNVHLV